jgi:hypothetical protein
MSKKTVTLILDEIEITESRTSAKIFALKENHRQQKIDVLFLPSFTGIRKKMPVLPIVLPICSP